MSFLSDGRWNRRLGWCLLIAALVSAAWLDPWSLGQRDSGLVVGSPQMIARHSQAVVVGMAFLQLMIGHVLADKTIPTWSRAAASLLSGAGALVYAAGYALHSVWAGGPWMTIIGALLNCLAFAALLVARVDWRGRRETQIVLAVLCCGMLLGAGMGLWTAAPERFLPEYIGGEDGVRLRMLRLARAAVIALSLLTLLYHGLALRSGRVPGIARWASIAMLIGAIGMPLILVIAAVSELKAKYLLGIPAHATFLGILGAIWLAYREAPRLELWGWVLVALSMGAGLFMGAYAFEGPLPTPDFLGAYNEFPRRLSRLAHAYCIILGLLSIFLARELENRRETWLTRIGVAGVVGGAFAMIVVPPLLPVIDLPLFLLSFGPLAVAAGTVLALASAKTTISKNLVSPAP